jgi:formate hydrogenlyase subunit 6/NADH:ubiquinone oxidoreductase subunit I
MLRKIRICLATLLFIGITLLFLDFTGTIHHWLGWMAQIQFLPALLAINLIIIVVLVLMTLIIGRVYCSVICPLGIFQDIVSWFSTRKNKNRYKYTKAKSLVRYISLGIFIILMILGVHSVALLIAPYSAYGRIAQNLFAPIYQAGNNVLAYFAERAESYAFYSVDVWIRSIPTFIIAAVTFIGIIILAWRGGRTWCNTICPVGTILGFLSKFAWFRPTIDTSKCVNCHACEKRCKASCIDSNTHTIDTSRCVACMNCIGNCHKGAISFAHVPYKKSAATENNTKEKEGEVSTARRGFLLSIPALAVASVAQAADDKTTDGGMADLKPRENPNRTTPVKPPGSQSLKNFTTRCTGCQLCVANCPNGVLRPSTSLLNLMQPEMHFDKGFCRPECTRCSEVCPTGAIQKMTKAAKISTQIGVAVWTMDLCLPATGKDPCGNCSRHCPNGAIIMVEHERDDGSKYETPSVDTERCIGCGACEFVCPVRPISAIHVEGNEVHHEN